MSGAPTVISSSIDPGDRGFATLERRARVRLWFDRLLAPRSVSRGTISFSSGEVQLVPRLRYEPVRREIELVLDPSLLRTDIEYVLTVRPGISSWDGVVARTGRAFRVRFVDGEAPSAQSAPTLRRDVLPLFERSCAFATCHGGREPAMGLDLSSVDGVRRTALGVVSSQWPAVAGTTDRGDVQWSGLQRIVSGEPGESYLLYKALGDGPVRGARMPRGARPWTADELSIVSAWIASGASE